MKEMVVSAGVVYFYLCGIMEDDNIRLAVADTYRYLPNEFYDHAFSTISEADGIADVIHMFGVIGIPEKIQKISKHIKAGLNENCDRILCGKRIVKRKSELDYLGNQYFSMVQEFFLEQPDHFPFGLCRGNEGWELNCIWCSNADEEKIHGFAESTIEIWLENEVPEIVGKQLMLRSFFTSDFANRKVVACIPKLGTSEWQMLFEGGSSVALGSVDFYKGSASPKSLGFFSVSGVNNILMNPIYSYGIYLYPDDICLEWHKVFLYLCAISDKEWNTNNLGIVYERFLDFLMENICDAVSAQPIIPKEQGLRTFLMQIKSVRDFLKGKDEPVISKDLFQLLNTRYVYLPYLTDLITINTGRVEMLSNKWITEHMEIAQNTEDTYQKGVLWENVAEYVLNHISGWRITGRRVRAGCQEIDLSVVNVSLNDELWQLGSYILVECKNWKRHVDIPQVRNIAYISTMKGNKTALLFALNGITKDAGNEIKRLASTGVYVLVITAKDIKGIKSNEGCRRMILDKFYSLYYAENLPV